MVKFIKDEIDIAEIDFLGHDKLADSILEAIKLAEPPFTFALYGSWGTGKTMLMKRAKSKLEDDGYAPIWFNTWEYESEPNLLWPLLKLIRGSVKWGKGQKQQVEKIFKAVSRCVLDIGTRVGAKVLSGGLLEYKLQDIEEQLAKEDTPEELYQDKVQYLKDKFNEYIELVLKKTNKDKKKTDKDKLIIFFDDLDRCSPDKMIELLESVKLFLFTGKCVFIFALDKNIVSEAITKKYIEMESFDGESYLEKIFGFSFNLSPPKEEQLAEIVEKQFKLLDDTILNQDTRKKDLLKLLITSNRNNPRVLKRFLNKLLFLTTVCPEIKDWGFERFACIFIFEFWPDFRKVLNSMEPKYIDTYFSVLFSYKLHGVKEQLERNNQADSENLKAIKIYHLEKFIEDTDLYTTLCFITQGHGNYNEKASFLKESFKETQEICESHGL